MMAISWNQTVIPLGRLGNIEQRLANWLNRRTLDRLVNRYGGIQQCPYCKQCAQSESGWYFDSHTDPMIDALHCGNCGGISRWRFEMGMVALDPIGLVPPYVPAQGMEAPQGVETTGSTEGDSPVAESDAP